MKFDIAAYRASKERVIHSIKSSHDWEKTEGFIADGVISPEVYASQPMRVLCVLAESYGYDECGMVDIEDQPRSDLMGVGSPKVKTPRRMAALLRLLLLSAEKGGSLVPEDEWSRMSPLLSTDGSSIAIHQDTLSKVAWINVKKASNPRGTKLDSGEAFSHAQRNKNILKEQIASIVPHLILVCGRDAFGSLLQMGLLGSGVSAGKLWKLQSRGDGIKLMQVSHPAYFPDWGSYDSIYKQYTIIHAQLWGESNAP